MTPEDVPPGPILVDTDVATWILSGADEREAWIPLVNGHILVLSFANVGELLALPVSRGWGQARRDEWKLEILSKFVVMPFNIAVAEAWAPLHIKYKGHLQKGGTNDLWVAASALSANPKLPVATNNLSDFQTVAADEPLTLIHPDL